MKRYDIGRQANPVQLLLPHLRGVYVSMAVSIHFLCFLCLLTEIGLQSGQAKLGVPGTST